MTTFAQDQSWTLSGKSKSPFFLLFCWQLIYLLIMSFVGIPNAGNDNGKTSKGPKPSLPHANIVSLSVQNKLYRKLLTAESTGSQQKAP